MFKRIALIALLLVLPFAGWAQNKDEKLDDYIQRVAVSGPAKIEIREQATLDLPKGYAFIPEKPAATLLESMGNKVGEEFVGLIVPEGNSDNDHWSIFVEYKPAGYVKDDDAQTMNADDLLNKAQNGLGDLNARRAEHHLPSLEILGWIEKPTYDKANRRLIWSLEGRETGATDPSKNIINYQMLQLGREGYVGMMMATRRNLIDGLKPTAAMLLSKIAYKPGKRYSDFNISTDKVAEYGLGALIVGVAAKKLGLIALGVAFFAKFAKIIIISVVAFFAAIRGKFRRKTVPKLPPPASPDT